MIPLGVHHFGKRTAWSLIYFLTNAYSEVPNRRADLNKRAELEKNATLLAYLVSKSINEYGGILCLLHKDNIFETSSLVSGKTTA